MLRIRAAVGNVETIKTGWWFICDFFVGLPVIFDMLKT